MRVGDGVIVKDGVMVGAAVGGRPETRCPLKVAYRRVYSLPIDGLALEVNKY